MPITKRKQCPVCGKPAVKYCSQICFHEGVYQCWKQDVLRKGRISRHCNATPRIKRFMAEQFGKHCAICGRKTWCGQTIALIFDHINGNHQDWCLSNCRLICSNCDAQLPTYKGHNRGKGRYSRRLRYQQGKSY